MYQMLDVKHSAMHAFEKKCMDLGKKCMNFTGGSALENALNFLIHIKKITIELLLKLKSRIENACIIAARAPRSLQ